MSKGIKYLLVSLPTSISPANEHDEALTTLRSTITNDYGSVFPFPIPDFKIGTLDALVQQADDLAKLDSSSEGVVVKVGDSLKAILEGDEEKISQQKTVNDSESIYNLILQGSYGLTLSYRTSRRLPQNVPLEQSQISSGQTDRRNH